MLKYREPLKVDSADESSLILPRELRDGRGGGGEAGGLCITQTHTLLSLLPVDSADEPRQCYIDTRLRSIVSLPKEDAIQARKQHHIWSKKISVCVGLISETAKSPSHKKRSIQGYSPPPHPPKKNFDFLRFPLKGI